MNALSTLELIQQDIEHAEMKLARTPVMEGFGQNEVNQLQNKYKDFLSDAWNPDATQGRKMILAFQEFCLSFTGEELAYA